MTRGKQIDVEPEEKARFVKVCKKKGLRLYEAATEALKDFRHKHTAQNSAERM